MPLLQKNLKMIFFLVLFTLTGCLEKPPTPLRIGAILWPGYEPLYVAKQLGYYEDQPIKIIDYLSNTDAILAFNNHNLEAGAFTLDETLQLLADNIEIDIVLIMDTSNGGDVILANENINNIKELKNKSVAVESSAVGAYVLTRALELNGMTLNDIKVVSTNAMEQASSFNKGNIDAAVSFDPYRTQLVKAGKKEIFNSKSIPNEIIDVLVVRKDYSQKNPKIIQLLINAWFKTLEYQRQNPVESAKFSLKRFNSTSEDYIANLNLLKFASKAENKILLDAKSSPLLSQQAKILEILKQLNLINSNPSLKNHLNSNFIPE